MAPFGVRSPAIVTGKGHPGIAPALGDQSGDRESDRASLIRPTAATIRRNASSMSASVVAAPKLKRTEERSRSAGTRMASKVGEGRVLPLAQAEPSEAATPARS